MAQILQKSEWPNEKPWSNLCCERCWFAAEERCVCKCGGLGHGRGLGQAKLDDFGEPNSFVKLLRHSFIS